MKKILFSITVALATVIGLSANAQSMKNTLKVGVLGGVSLPNTNAVANAGVDVAYQNLVTNHIGLGVSTGYQQYFGKENEINSLKLKNNSFGLVPVALLLHYYPSSTGIYVGTDIGYGFLVGDELVASNALEERPNGGFYIKPEIGWHSRYWNVYAHYTKAFTGNTGEIKVGSETQKYNAGTLGLGVAYNIGLGR